MAKSQSADSYLRIFDKNIFEFCWLAFDTQSYQKDLVMVKPGSKFEWLMQATQS